MIPKQDKVQARTVAQLEQEYNFKKSFAEVMGIAKDAQETAEKADTAVKELDKTFDAEEVFNRLTENGTLQGLYRGDDGELYVNATYIKSGEFSADLIKTVKFTAQEEVFIEPEEEEWQTIRQHLLGNITIPTELIPLYDTNGDGKISITDLANFQMARLGKYSIANMAGAKKSLVTLSIDLTNPDKIICITGKNMWGRTIEKYVGLNSSNIENKNIANHIIENGESGIWQYRKWADGTAECWGETTATPEVLCPWGSGYLSSKNGGNETAALYFAFPNEFFSQIIDGEAKAYLGGYVLLASQNALDSGGISFYIWSPLQSLNSTQRVTIRMYAKGKWK